MPTRRKSSSTLSVPAGIVLAPVLAGLVLTGCGSGGSSGERGNKPSATASSPAAATVTLDQLRGIAALGQRTAGNYFPGAMVAVESPINECGSDLPYAKEAALIKGVSADADKDASGPTKEEAALAEVGETAVYVQVLADAKAISQLDARIASSIKSCIEDGITREVVETSIPGADAGFIFQGKDEKMSPSKTYQATAHARVGNAELVCFARGKAVKNARDTVASCITDLVGGVKVLANAATTPTQIAGKTLLTKLSTPTRRVRFSPIYPTGLSVCQSLTEPLMTKETSSDVFTPDEWQSQPEKNKDIQSAILGIQTEKDAAAAQAFVAKAAKSAAGCTGETKPSLDAPINQLLIKDLGSQPATVGDGGFVVTKQMSRFASNKPPQKFRKWVFSIGPHVIHVSENQWGQADQILKDLNGMSGHS